MSNSNSTLGIIAGGGPIPGRVAAAAAAAGRGVFIVGLEGFADPEILAPWPHAMVRLGAAGKLLSLMRNAQVKDLVLIGPIRRPSFLSLYPDADGAKLIARIGRAAFSGDDGLLAAVVRVLGEEGFRVLGAHEVLTEALAPKGLLTRAAPDAAMLADIRRGVDVVRMLGAADVGQCCVVQQGVVLAVEAIEGTDAMLARAATLRHPGAPGVLVKLVKPGQERRADLPTIGANTVAGVKAAGLAGIAFEGDGTILADRPATIAAADEAGVFLLGLDEAEIKGSTS